MKKKLIVSLAAAMLAMASCSAQENVEGELTGLPSPIVEYGSYAEAAEAAGLTPLYLPTGCGYRLDYISVISGQVADLGFTRLGDDTQRVRVRTAKVGSYGESDAGLSGVWGANWQAQQIDGAEVEVAKVEGVAESSEVYAARWKVAGYGFSVLSDGLTRAQFQNLLEDAFVELSTHYYRQTAPAANEAPKQAASPHGALPEMPAAAG